MTGCNYVTICVTIYVLCNLMYIPSNKIINFDVIVGTDLLESLLTNIIAHSCAHIIIETEVKINISYWTVI